MEDVFYQKGTIDQDKGDLRYRKQGIQYGRKEKRSLDDGKGWSQETAVYQA